MNADFARSMARETLHVTHDRMDGLRVGTERVDGISVMHRGTAYWSDAHSSDVEWADPVLGTAARRALLDGAALEPTAALASPQAEVVDAIMSAPSRVGSLRPRLSVEAVSETRKFSHGLDGWDGGEDTFVGTRLRVDLVSAERGSCIWSAETIAGRSDAGALIDALATLMVKLSDQEEAASRATKYRGKDSARILFRPGPAAALIHEAFGHPLERDIWKTTPEPERSELARTRRPFDLWQVPNRSHVWGQLHIDDVGNPIGNSLVLAGDGSCTRPLSTMRAESHRWPPSARMTALEARPITTSAPDLTPEDYDLVIDAVESAKYLPGRRMVLMEVSLGHERSGQTWQPVRSLRLGVPLQSCWSSVYWCGEDIHDYSGHCYKGAQRVRVSTRSPSLAVSGIQVQGRP